MPTRSFSDRLLAWHARFGRHDLPWQSARTAYRVWLSEVMLQQTQVATVIPYYERFVARFPDCATLARAPLDEVLHLWSGLGYYARARNLHRAAQVIVAQHAGEFPRTLEDALALPGIGRSTAAAILALSAGQRHAILDGNVKRVLTRHFAISGWPDAPHVQKQLWALADELTPAVETATYTQAIMDLGATVCTRATPRCAHCPLSTSCAAHAAATVDQYPSPKPKRQLPERHTRFLMLQDATGAWLLQRRPPSGIWGGLWSFPELVEHQRAEEWCATHALEVADTFHSLAPLTHTFTHFRLTIAPHRARVSMRNDMLMDSANWLWYNNAAPARVGLATPVRTLLRTLDTLKE